jgi:hypothetical protein
MHPTGNNPSTTEQMAMVHQIVAQQLAHQSQTQAQPHPAGWSPSITQATGQAQPDTTGQNAVMLLLQHAIQQHATAQVSAAPAPVEAPVQLQAAHASPLAETQKLLELLASGDPNVTQQLQVLLAAQLRDSPQTSAGLLADRQLDPSQAALALPRTGAGVGLSRHPDLPVASRCVLSCCGNFHLKISHPLAVSVKVPS